MNQILVPLQEIIPQSNIGGLKTLIEISQIDKAPEWCDLFSKWNPKPATPQFFIYSDYFLDAGQHLQGQIVVDLGCGLFLHNYELARIFGAKAYVGVDKYNARSLFDKFQNQTEHEQKPNLRESVDRLSGWLSKKTNDLNASRLRKNLESFLAGNLLNIPATIASEDMLDFLGRLPSGCVSILTGRIDKCMISDDDYAQKVELEIARVLHPEGSHVSYKSRFNGSRLVEHKMDDSYTRFGKR